MKKIILFLLLAVSLSSMAQLSDGNLYYKFNGTAADTSSVYTTWNKIISPNATFALFYNFAVKITEVTATTNVSVALQGAKFDNGSYATIGSAVRYYGGGSDTTILFSQESTKQFYNYYKVLITPANGKVKTTYIRAYFRK